MQLWKWAPMELGLEAARELWILVRLVRIVVSMDELQIGPPFNGGSK